MNEWVWFFTGLSVGVSLGFVVARLIDLTALRR
jgi:uncharacterized membrane-anchored protein YhcB (DUF1043 family)